MKNELKLELEKRFQKSLNDLYEVSQKSGVKETLPYGGPMNLRPVLSSTEYMDVKTLNIEDSSAKSVKAIVKRYGGLKGDLKAVASEINMLSRLETMKGEYVKKREDIKNYTGLTDFEKINKERELKAALKKVKEGISEMSGKIDKRMENINLRISDLGRLKDEYEKRHFEISSALSRLKKGEPLKESIASKFDGDGLKKALKYKRDLADGITLCDQIVTLAKDRKDALNRSMWMGSTIVEKTVMEKMEIPKSINQKKNIAREL